MNLLVKCSDDTQLEAASMEDAEAQLTAKYGEAVIFGPARKGRTPFALNSDPAVHRGHVQER